MLAPFFGTSPCASVRIFGDEQCLSGLLVKEVLDGQGTEGSPGYLECEFGNRTPLSSTGVPNTP